MRQKQQVFKYHRFHGCPSHYPSTFLIFEHYIRGRRASNHQFQTHEHVPSNVHYHLPHRMRYALLISYFLINGSVRLYLYRNSAYSSQIVLVTPRTVPMVCINCVCIFSICLASSLDWRNARSEEALSATWILRSDSRTVRVRAGSCTRMTAYRNRLAAEPYVTNSYFS